MKEIVFNKSNLTDEEIDIEKEKCRALIVDSNDNIIVCEYDGVYLLPGGSKEGNESNIVDILKTPNPDFIEDITVKDNIKKLNKYIDVLTEREKKIITKRYGLYGENEMTQKSIAKELKISRSYVSRIEKSALTKLLREFIRNNKTN